MAIKKFEFTKDWRNPTDFPTYEPNEIRVREDLQYQPDEIKNFLNSLVDHLESSGASDMGASVEGLEADTVEEALSELLSIQKKYEESQAKKDEELTNQIGNMGSDLEETKKVTVTSIDVNEEENIIVLHYIDGSTYTVDCSGFATSESLKEIENKLTVFEDSIGNELGSVLVSVYFDEESNGLVMRRKDGTEEFITSIGGSGSGTVSTANAAIVKQITIPKSGWVNRTETSDFPYYIDLSETSAKALRVPIVIIDDGYHEIARDSQISVNASTSDGTLHLDAKNIPSGDMEATLILIVPGSSESSSTTDPDIATDEEVQDAIDSVFGQ